MDSTTPIFGGKAAAILAGIFVAGLALFAVLAAADRVHRPQLETIHSLPPLLKAKR
jgi:hypothetical protein